LPACRDRMILNLLKYQGFNASYIRDAGRSRGIRILVSFRSDKFLYKFFHIEGLDSLGDRWGGNLALGLAMDHDQSIRPVLRRTLERGHRRRHFGPDRLSSLGLHQP